MDISDKVEDHPVKDFFGTVFKSIAVAAAFASAVVAAEWGYNHYFFHNKKSEDNGIFSMYKVDGPFHTTAIVQTAEGNRRITRYGLIQDREYIDKDADGLLDIYRQSPHIFSDFNGDNGIVEFRIKDATKLPKDSKSRTLNDQYTDQLARFKPDLPKIYHPIEKP